MSGQGDFDLGREPADLEHAALPDEEGRFRKVVFRGDGLHHVGGNPAFERTDRGGIAAEKPVGEGVDLIDGDFHSFSSVRSLDRKNILPQRRQTGNSRGPF